MSFLFGCKQKLSSLHIVLSKSEKEDSTSISINGLYLKNYDSTFYKLQRPNQINFQDTIKIDSIPHGTYTLEYIDIIGNKIFKTIKVKENLKQIQILTDSIDTGKYENQIPFSNLKKRKLKQSEIDAVKKFESELLTINGKDICLSTGRRTFKINSDNPKQIIDNTCNWNGWSNLFSVLNK